MPDGTGNGGMFKRAADAAKAAPVVASLITGALALAPLVTLLAAFGVSPVFWAWPSDVDRVQERLVELEVVVWKMELDDATQELAANPGSRSARLRKYEAELKLRRADRRGGRRPNR